MLPSIINIKSVMFRVKQFYNISLHNPEGAQKASLSINIVTIKFEFVDWSREVLDKELFFGGDLAQSFLPQSLLHLYIRFR